MRLFVAVVPPAEVGADLEAAVQAVRRAAPDGAGAVRWALPVTWHLTLAFLGEVDESRVADLQARLTRAAGRHETCSLAVTGAGRFDGTVLWAGVTGDTERLRRLAASVTAAARRAGALPAASEPPRGPAPPRQSRQSREPRPLRPHLTLARSSRPVDLRPLVEALRGYTGPAWTAREAVLVRSRLGAGPGRTPAYDTVSTHPLRPRPAVRRIPLE